MKKKLLITVLSVVALLLLAGVGYATWVISQNMEETANGNIVVETVSDERLEVTVTPATGAEFIFGHPAGATSGWLTARGDDDKQESKTVNYVVTITKKGSSATFTDENEVDVTGLYMTDLNANFMAWDSTDTDATSGKLKLTETSRSLSADSKTITVNLTASIKWGTLMGGDNPYTYFNAQTVGDAIGSTVATAATAADALGTGSGLDEDSTWAEYALAYLTYFNTHFDATTFEIKVVVAYH